MNDLDPDFMALFSTSAFSSSHELIEAIGLNILMPEATIDAKIFEPCGFSLNAIYQVRLLVCANCTTINWLFVKFFFFFIQRLIPFFFFL